MRHLYKALTVIVLSLMMLASFGQATLFYQAQFNGGVTTGGYSPAYSAGGTGSFTLSIAPGSTIYKAWLMAGRQGANAGTLTVTLNGNNVTFNNTNQVSSTFQSPLYGGASGVHAVDVTALINPVVNNYTLVIPTQGGPNNRYNDFYLYVAYANNSLSQVSTAIFLNSVDMQSNVNDALTLPYSINNTNNVCLSFFTGYICDISSDGDLVSVNGTQIGTIGGSDFNSQVCGGPIGSFGYQNGALTGLGDDNANQAVSGPEALSNIQNLVTPCATSVEVDFTTQQASNQSNAIWALILAYSSGSQPLNLGPDTTVCNGNAVQLNAPSGASVTWSPTTGLSCTSCINPVATPSATTTYAASITGGSCGNSTDSITITVITNSTVTIQNNDTTICAGNPVQISTITNGTLLWTPNTGLSCYNCNNPIATPASTTTYVATNGGGGCIAQDSFVISVQLASTLSVNNDTLVCEGSQVPLIATSTGNVTWSPATNLSCTVCNFSMATPSNSITYYANVGSGMCALIDSVAITVIPPPAINITNHDTTICNGQTVTLNATSNLTAQWSPTANLSCISCNNTLAAPTATTTYLATVGTGTCIASDSVHVIVVTLPTLSVSSDTSVCTGTPVQLSSTSNAGVIWSPAAGLSCTACNNPIANAPANTISYTATAGSGSCIVQDNVTITVINYPALNILNNDTAICLGQSVQINAVSGNTINWWPTTTLSCSSCNSPVATPTTSNTTYVGTAANSGCAVSDSVTVNTIIPPALTVSNDTSVCAGNSAQLNAESNAGIVWLPNSNLSCSACNDAVVTPSNTSTYYAFAANGACVVTDSVLVTIIQYPSMAVSYDTSICTGGSAALNAASNGNVIWLTDPTLTCTACNNPVATPATNTVYYVTANNFNCAVTDSVSVTVVNYPTLTVSGDTIICPGNSTALSATGSSPVSWTPTINLSCANCNTSIATPLITTVYTATSANGNCSIQQSVTVNINNPTTISMSSDIVICSGDTVTIQATANAPVVWNSAADMSCDSCNTPNIHPKQTTVYTAIAGSNGCTASGHVTVTVNSSNVQANEDVTIESGNSVQLHVIGADSAYWVPAFSLQNATSLEPTAFPTVSTFYKVYGYRDGCWSVDSVWVFVIEPCEKLLLPSAFSPNNDGVNDVLHILNKNYDQLNWFRVYNRWGDLVFETKEIFDGWDGTFKEYKQPMGVYTYSVSVTCRGKVAEYKGNITLIR